MFSEVVLRHWVTSARRTRLQWVQFLKIRPLYDETTRLPRMLGDLLLIGAEP
jgi:hypothetical protein